MDNKATQYFVKLHIIAGQMNTERMNNTDTFYTLTGRSGEIFNGDKVRVSPMFTPRRKLSAESVPTAGPPFVFVKKLSYIRRSGEQHQKGSGRSGVDCYKQGGIK